MLAIDNTTVVAAVGNAAVFMDQKRRTPAEDYLRVVFDDTGRARPTPPDQLRRAARQPWACGHAGWPRSRCNRLVTAAYPTIVLVGGRDPTAPQLSAFDPVLPLVAPAVADRTGVEPFTVPGAGHHVQRDQPERTNDLLRRLWSTGDATLPVTPA